MGSRTENARLVGDERKVKILVDTNVMVAGLVVLHPHHGSAEPWLKSIQSGQVELVLAAHNLAEVYSSLTSLPIKPRISPPIAWSMISQNVIPHARFETLPVAEYQSLVQKLSQAGLGGGIVYDGLIARVAELAGVDLLVTFNVSHFLQVWPAGAGRIVSPLTTLPPMPPSV